MKLTSTVEWLTACTVQFCSVLKYTISLHFTAILSVINYGSGRSIQKDKTFCMTCPWNMAENTEYE